MSICNEINKKLNEDINDIVLNKYNKMEINLSLLNKQELLQKCLELGILKTSSKNKAQLIEMIQIKLNQSTIFEIIDDNDCQNTVLKSTPTPILRLKPIIKWSGGKSDEIKQFEQYLPTSYDTYLEPFIGGGSLFFHLAPLKAVISDVHKELIDLYTCIGSGKAKEIHEFMALNPNDEETYYKIRDKMEITCSLDSAKRFYYQRKTCFRGMLRYNKDGKFNIPFGRYKTINYSELLNTNYEQLLDRTTVLNQSFEYVFENYNDENNFMFLDPPYDSEFTDYGYCQFGKEHQKRLAELFKTTKIKCLMVIGKTKFIEELYAGYIVSEYDKKYKFKLYAGRVGDEINTKHLIIKNY